MAVVTAFLAYVVLLPFIALGLCVGVILMFGKPTKARPAPAPKAQKPKKAPAPKPVPAAPRYIRRWSNTRRAWEINELERFQQLLDD